MAEYIFRWREDLKGILLEECEWKILRKVCYVLSDFLMNRINFCWRIQAFASYQTWFPQVWRKCFPSNFSTHKSGVFYRYKCDRVECDEEYISESSRTFGERFKEHQKAPSPIFDHYNTTGHNISIENFEIVGREDQNLIRTIKQALYIRVNDPSLNRNIGKYHLPHMWDEVLLDISELKL